MGKQNREQFLMHGRITIKLEKEIYGEIRRSGNAGCQNFETLYYLATNIRVLDSARKLQRLKQDYYDETTEYLHEALAIAETNQSCDIFFISALIYHQLFKCEMEKEGKTNIQKAMEYHVKGTRIMPNEPVDYYDWKLTNEYAHEYEKYFELIERKFKTY